MTRTLVAALVLSLIAHAAGAQAHPVPATPATPAPVAPVAPIRPAVPVQPFATPMPAPWPDPFAWTDVDADSAFTETMRALADVKLSLEQQPFLFAAPPQPVWKGGSEEASYDRARNMIERNQYEQALDALDRVIEKKGNRADAALYWKAYSLSKLARKAEALSVLGELQKQYAKSAWVNDARALDVEIRQSAGQSVSADTSDDEIKVLALRGMMQSDPETSVPIIEKLLAGTSSVRVKDRALFVLSQSRSTRARDAIAGVAKGGSNPDLRMAAIRYLGMRSDADSRQVLDDVYRSTNDVEVKRAILRSFMMSGGGAKERLLAIAKTEKSPDLRGEAVQQLGVARAGAELEELYRSETDREVRQRILQAMFVANASDRLGQIARSEKDPDLQRAAIRNLGLVNRQDATESLIAIYKSDTPIETKRAVIDALALHQNATALVDLARAEKNAELKQEIVRRLSVMKSPAARDYMLELLK